MLHLDRLRKVIQGEAFDVIHCHEPDALAVGLRLKKTTGARVIYDSHESWGAVFAQRLPSVLWRGAAAAFQLWERSLLKRCDGAIGASWAIADWLRQHLPADRVATILNVPVPEVFGPAPEWSWGDTTVLCHDGHLGFDRGLKTMVQAVGEVARHHKVVFRIVGDVFNEPRAWLESYVREHRLEGVIQRTGWLPYEQVGRHIGTCHIGLVAFQRLPNNVVTSSNKVFNYMLYGLPFVGPDFRLAKIKLAREERCGRLADSASPASYAQAITRMIEDRKETLAMRERALAASRSKYRWEHMERELVRLYNTVLDGVADPLEVS